MKNANRSIYNLVSITLKERDVAYFCYINDIESILLFDHIPSLYRFKILFIFCFCNSLQCCMYIHALILVYIFETLFRYLLYVSNINWRFFLSRYIQNIYSLLYFIVKYFKCLLSFIHTYTHTYTQIFFSLLISRNSSPYNFDTIYILLSSLYKLIII